MPGDMKLEESSITGYLVKNLEPLTEADPAILAEYVATLLKKDKPCKELQKLCTENLVEFLGNETEPFVSKLFQDLEDGLVVSIERQDKTKQVEAPSVLTTVEPVEQESLSPKLKKFPSSSGPCTDPEEKEISDDDDDDRNHKHRRRGTRTITSDKVVQEQFFRRHNRKRERPFDNGQSFLGSDPQPSIIQKEYKIAPLEVVKFEKRHAGLASLSHNPLDLGQRTRLSQNNLGDSGSRFDASTVVSRQPIGRGRGRSNVPWNHLDSRFGTIETPDFSPQIPPQGPIPPSLFSGRGIPDAAATQNATWGPFALYNGMPNGGLDTLHPLGLQGSLRPSISPLNIGIPRQRCRDFEERGFCLRGDMCPMEHGVNRIVVEDVQSLSQFNLPVSIPSARLQGGSGLLPSVTSSARPLSNSKGLNGKVGMPGVTDVGLGLNGTFPGSSDAVDTDLYDPDQPLWNNDDPDATGALLRLTSPKPEDGEPVLDADPADHHNIRSADGNDCENLGRSLAAAQSTASSVWVRIGNPGNRLELTGRIEDSMTGHLGNESRDDQEERQNNNCGSVQPGKLIMAGENGSKSKNLFSAPKLHTESGRNIRRMSQKAQRTLFVNGIPLKNNKREALLSHFKKFGLVIDIYIPVNSEKAFVQFSKREEAEAALKAPDAVMGNRFIKLWWANRDNIRDDGGCIGAFASAPSSGPPAASISSHPSSERCKETNQSVVSKLGNASVSDTTLLGNAPKFGINATKVALPSPKKLETLEHLKEELRKKQELLDQKRSDFRRQLDKLEKQASMGKVDTAFDQTVKKPKVDSTTDGVKSLAPRHTNSVSTDLQEAEKTQGKNLGENVSSSNAKIHPVALQQSPRSVKTPIRLPASSGSPFHANRFKLDNRPTTFRILPPFPADFANVPMLKEHFSQYGELLRVELEDPDVSDDSLGSKASENVSARISFLTHVSAQRAFINGKCLQGHVFEFKWLTTSSNSSSNHGGGEVPSSHKGPLEPENPVDAHLTAGKSISQAAASSEKNVQGSVGEVIDNPENMPKIVVEGSPPGKLFEEKPLKKDGPLTGDVMTVDTAE